VTSVREAPAPAPARPAREPRVRAFRYGPFARFGDWYHGWQDGRAEIPPRPPRGAPRRIVSTAHREVLIRWAQGAFAQERERLERIKADAESQRAAAKARQDSAQLALDRVNAELADVSHPMTPEERLCRRHGEEHHPEAVIAQRRLREQRRRVSAARADVQRAEQELARAAEELARAAKQIDGHMLIARIRARRIHEHAHLRLASYRRRLIHAHPYGAWVNDAMGITQPELPLWGFPPPEEPDLPPSSPPPPPEQREPGEEDRPIRERPLGTRTIFGSDETEDDPDYWLVPDAAPQHFVLSREHADFQLRDFGHGHGPFINGKQATNSLLGPGDYFDFGPSRYRISADGTSLAQFPLFPAALIVAGLSAKTGETVRLSDMSFVQRENQLVAILGPSGAGKTSLFFALVGELKPEHGDLYFGPLSLRTHGAQIRDLLGFVPQDEHLFQTFTVRQLLRYAFRLRSPSNAGRREQRIAEVCEWLEISEQLNQLVGTLSGGQRKRVSIAVELLSKPRLLMLDEPTSGLDAGMDQEVLKLLRDYAEQGNTVIVITHSTEHLHQAHQALVIARGGRPVYYGRPGGVLAALGTDNYAALMKNLINDPRPAAVAYQNGPAAAEAAAVAEHMAREPVGSGPAAARLRKVMVTFRQFRVLVQRQTALLRTRGSINRGEKDHPLRRARGILTVLGPLLIAGAGATLADLVSGADGLGLGHGKQGSVTASTALSLLITLAMLTGQALTYSDVVNDYPTIRREHRTGMFTLPVMASKWLVFGIVAALQALIITFIYVQLRPAPAYSVFFGPITGLFINVAAMTVAAMTLGLLISAAMPKLEQAIAAATGVSIAQIALNGVASNLSANPAMNAVAMVLPSRWGLAATASSVNLRHISPAANPDPLWSHSLFHWASDLAMLGVLTGAYFALACWLLARRLNKPG
jgi:ABC-type multidrug transport system ATPase subunit